MEKQEYRGFWINIHQDGEPMNPRTEWDNFGHMICFHRNYILGDKHDFSNPEEFQESMKGEKVVILPLYLYDHSGITMNTTGFSCRWDSGQVGWIYATYDEIRKAYSVKNITKKVKEKISSYLQGEVETYDQYLTGQVYGYTIEPKETNKAINCDDSRWGFFGDPEENMTKEAKSAIDWSIQEYKKTVIAGKQKRAELETFVSNNFAL